MRIEFSQICKMHEREEKNSEIKLSSQRSVLVHIYLYVVLVCLVMCKFAIVVDDDGSTPILYIFATVVPSSDFEMCKYYFVIYVWWFCRINFHFFLFSSCWMWVSYRWHIIFKQQTYTHTNWNRFKFFFLGFVCRINKSCKKCHYQNAIKLRGKKADDKTIIKTKSHILIIQISDWHWRAFFATVIHVMRADNRRITAKNQHCTVLI